MKNESIDELIREFGRDYVIRVAREAIRSAFILSQELYLVSSKEKMEKLLYFHRN